MRLNVVASKIVVLFLAITLFDGTQSRKITGDDIETLDNKGTDFFYLSKDYQIEKIFYL